MPRFITRRSISGVSQQELYDTGRRAVGVLSGMTGIRWIRSCVSDADGKIYCEYDAPSVETVRELMRRVGVVVEHITEVTLEVVPEMFL